MYAVMSTMLVSGAAAVHSPTGSPSPACAAWDDPSRPTATARRSEVRSQRNRTSGLGTTVPVLPRAPRRVPARRTRNLTPPRPPGDNSGMTPTPAALDAPRPIDDYEHLADAELDRRITAARAALGARL